MSGAVFIKKVYNPDTEVHTSKREDEEGEEEEEDEEEEEEKEPSDDEDDDEEESQIDEFAEDLVCAIHSTSFNVCMYLLHELQILEKHKIFMWFTRASQLL